MGNDKDDLMTAFDAPSQVTTVAKRGAKAAVHTTDPLLNAPISSISDSEALPLTPLRPERQSDYVDPEAFYAWVSKQGK